MNHAWSVIGILFLCALGMADVPIEEISKEQVLAAGPEWRDNYDNHMPSPERVEVLKSKLLADLRIDIYIGLWCSDSQNNVPPFMKILDSTEIPVRVRYFSVRRKPAPTIQFYVDRVRVERVPTFIFYRNDREIGRIVENPEISLTEDMIKVLSQ